MKMIILFWQNVQKIVYHVLLQIHRYVLHVWMDITIHFLEYVIHVILNVRLVYNHQLRV